MEERTVQSEELKRKNRELYEQNSSLVKDVSSLKERVRELTELLREWEYKYEGKVNEMASSWEEERDFLIDENEKRLVKVREDYEQELKRVDE